MSRFENVNCFAAEAAEASERQMKYLSCSFAGNDISTALAVPPKKVSRRSRYVVLRTLRPLWQSFCLLVTAGLLSACATQPLNPTIDERPWLKSLIASIEQEPVWNPPATITRYTYKGAPVYFLAAHCCDIRSKLYDANGALICEPDGGFTGRGDGKCEDFIATRTDEQLVWRDPRGK